MLGCAAQLRPGVVPRRRFALPLGRDTTKRGLPRQRRGRHQQAVCHVGNGGTHYMETTMGVGGKGVEGVGGDGEGGDGVRG